MRNKSERGSLTTRRPNGGGKEREREGKKEEAKTSKYGVISDATTARNGEISAFVYICSSFSLRASERLRRICKP